MKNLLAQTQKIFEPDGILSKLLKNYESRPGQLEMASAVAEILAGGKLAVEAETGIGKTLAYLVPAVLSQQKVLISTNTLNLQEQILKSEIPFIQKHIDPQLSVLCVKGRQNYLCLYRWQQFDTHPQRELFAPDETRTKINHWLDITTTGDRAELDWLEDNSPLWREISATPSQCLGSKCPNDKTCFINELRRQAAKARILIVNHHLFFSDLALRREGHGEVLPRYESVIFDEAHNIENVATSFFGFSLSIFQISDLAKDIKLAASHLLPDSQVKLTGIAEALQARAEHFSTIFPARPGKYPLEEFIENCPDWEHEVQAAADRLSLLESALSTLISEGEIWQAFDSRCQELKTRLLAFGGLVDIPNAETYVRWYERRDKTLILTASPIDIALELNSVLYPNVRSVVFTSGTLTVNGDFSYFLNRLGLDQDTETLTLKSPFDYAGRTLLFVPTHTADNPFPQPDQENFPERIKDIICHILLASGGRGLVLFTSINSMRRA
jgi:ATP-dependent DNA helicase DinG